MAFIALQHAWTTQFVLLPMQNVPPALIAGANMSMAKSDIGTPLMGQMGAEGTLMLTLDSQFRTAASTSAAALSALLLDIEQKHFARLRGEIESEGGPGL